MNRGVELKRKGRLDAAIADSSAAIARHADYAAAYTNRGRIHETRNEPRRARADYEAALATSAQHDNSRAARSFARQRLPGLQR